LTECSSSPIITAMKKYLTKYLIVLMVMFTTGFAYGQLNTYTQPRQYDKSSFYLLMGYLDGPSFKDYIDWANGLWGDSLGAPERLNDFSAGFCLTLGLRTRFSQYFALEVDFLTASKSTRTAYHTTNDGTFYNSLDLTVGAITVSVPIIFQFTEGQRVVPFIAAGGTVFPLRLDHTLQFTDRWSKTALAGNFSFGLESKVQRKITVTARLDRTFGKAKMPVARYPGTPEKFDIDLSTTQIQAGVMYAFQ
jgi:opacity protein-like surface antigen